MDAGEQLSRPRVALATALVLLATCLPAQADEMPPPFFQAYLGVLKLDDQTGRFKEGNGEPVDVDFSSLPTGGFELEYLFGRGFLHWGLNPGASVTWKNKDTEFSGSLTREDGGTLVYEADNSLLLVDIHLGGFVRGRLHERVTAYIAGGPMVMYGSHDREDEDVEERPPVAVPFETPTSGNSSSTDVNVGFYGRAGVDFQIMENRHIGFSVRYITTELDFNRTIGKIDIKGPQYVMTFSARL